MSEKVVLPKFDLPGQGPHPAVRAVWITGGMLALAMLILGGAMWRHHSLQVAAEARAQALIAARAAEAAAAVEEAKARAAEAAAKIAAAKAAAAHPVAVAPAKAVTDGEPTALPAAHRHARHHATGKGGKALAKSDPKSGGARPSGSKRDDAAIDKLLASFK
jgi:hypothetical protein